MSENDKGVETAGGWRKAAQFVLFTSF